MDKENTRSVLLKNFATYADAMLVKEILENKGIKSGIQKGSLNTLGEFTGWVGDADMFVLEDKYEEVKKIIEIYFKEK